MLKLIAKLPFGLLYKLSAVLYWLAFYVVRYRRKVVFAHLRQAFPERSEYEIRTIAKGFYRNFAEVALEIFKAGSMSRQELAERVSFDNPEVVQPLIERRQSFILLSAHYCNWEWLLLATSLKLPIPIDVVYKPLHNSGVDRFMYETRSRFGVEPIDLNDFTNEVIKRKDQQRAYAILADQKPRNKGRAHTTMFLNRETRFFIGPEKIAQFVKIPVVLVTMKRQCQGRYRVAFELIGQPPYAKVRDSYPVTERYARALEAQIKSAPQGWLWSNRRWRSRREERTQSVAASR